MKQNVATNLLALQMHNSDMTVVSGSKSYPQSWCYMPTLFWEISEILDTFGIVLIIFLT